MRTSRYGYLYATHRLRASDSGQRLYTHVQQRGRFCGRLVTLLSGVLFPCCRVVYTNTQQRNSRGFLPCGQLQHTLRLEICWIIRLDGSRYPICAQLLTLSVWPTEPDPWTFRGMPWNAAFNSRKSVNHLELTCCRSTSRSARTELSNTRSASCCPMALNGEQHVHTCAPPHRLHPRSSTTI
ncbi:hypothetical protein BDV95DRAFT_48198 [Massariosphaeria phaeospora]|uniref:Uncharacterized protein n=1 Tax=Massariosphaeria phaeospora TaxID=100035 RepID=A0A7C8MP79_9PLEO|nr:hypothetical protein BDV95DRAFT_48198 [Massariosphaeria phaeospora]